MYMKCTTANILSHAREVGSPANPLSAGADWKNQPFSPFNPTTRIIEKHKIMLLCKTLRQGWSGTPQYVTWWATNHSP